MKQRKMKMARAVTNFETNGVEPLINTRYCGEAKSGHIKLRRENVTLYGIGCLYEVISSRIVEGERKVRLNATPTRTTPDLDSSFSDAQRRIACVGQKSGREFRFIGKIVSRKKYIRDVDRRMPIAPIWNEPGPRKESVARLARELTLISGARASGFDPSLKLTQVCAILQESRSSVYRKISSGIFPPQIKRGNGSFWLLSHIEAYAAGQWGRDKIKR